jgi:hypothetical protein
LQEDVEVERLLELPGIAVLGRSLDCIPSVRGQGRVEKSPRVEQAPRVGSQRLPLNLYRVKCLSLDREGQER